MARNAKARTEKEGEEREQALAVLARMRRSRLKLKAASKTQGIDPKTVRRYVGSALRAQGTKGNYRATKYDRIPRQLNFPTSTGQLELTIRDSRTASRIGEYLNAIRSYLYSADIGPIASFLHKSFKSGGVTYRFVVEPKTLDRLGHAGLLVVDGLYRAFPGGRFE